MDDLCTIDGCTRATRARGWCATHYARWQRHGDPRYERPRQPEFCTIDGCEAPEKSTGMCSKHYTRKLRGRPVTKDPYLSVDERLALRVDRSNGPDACWPWMGARNTEGYGSMGINGRKVYVHRLVLARALGRELTADEVTCHRCDNPPCCNPAHLVVGTQADNMADKEAKGRGIRTCPHDEDNWYRRKSGDRKGTVAYCRACVAEDRCGRIVELEVPVIDHPHPRPRRRPVIDVTVHGLPAPQGSKRYVGNGISIESSKAVKPWRTDIKATIEAALPHDHTPYDGAVTVTLVFVFPRPKSHHRTGKNAHLLRDNAPQWPANSRNDIDKLSRAVLDAITAAGAWKDDGLVVRLDASKVYGDRPGCRITVIPLLPTAGVL